MTSMKYIILTALTFVSVSSFALGGGGGGGVMGPMTMAAQNFDALGGTGGGGVLHPEIVFHMGEQNGQIKFAYGQIINKKWQIQKIELSKDDLTLSPSVIKALRDSENLKSWVEIK